MEARTRGWHDERSAADRAVVGRLYSDHAAALFAYLARRVGRTLAEDLVAETFRVAIESSPTFDADRGTHRMWLFGIATNLVRRHWRTEQRRLLALERAAGQHRSIVDPLIARLESTAARVDAEREALLVLHVVAELPPQDRDLLILSGWEHLNSSEIGRVLGIPAPTVRSRLRRLRADVQSSVQAAARAASPSPTGPLP